MAFPRAAGMQDLSGTYIPEIWSGKLLVKFYKSTVFGDIANTDYEGEITKKGDKVYIRTVPDVEIRDYIEGNGLKYDTYKSENVELLIDKGKYFGFKINDVSKAQSDIDYMDKWSDDAAQQMKIKIDADVLADIYDDCATENQGDSAGLISGNIDLGKAGAPVEISKANAMDVIVMLGQILDEQNVPETERFVIIPAWFATRLKLSDLKNVSMTGDGTSTVRNGRIGQIDRFTLYSSNNLAFANDAVYGGNVWNIIFGHKSALTFATQLVENETLKNPNDFGDLVRGLQVYGYEVIKPEALGWLRAAPVALA